MKYVILAILILAIPTYAKFGKSSGAGSSDLGSATGTLAPANGGTSSSLDIINCSLTGSVGSNILTIALKDGAGSDPSASSPCKIGFRNATAATGTYAVVSATAATSVAVSNGSSLGCTASAQCVLHVYAVNNAGTIVLGVKNGYELDEGSVQSGVAEGAAGGADSLNVLYTTATQSSKAVRYLGRLTVTPGGSHAWTAAPTEISLLPAKKNSAWYINASISGADPSLGVAAVTSYTEITDAGLTLTPIAGSAPTGIMCSGTNAATAAAVTATTCAAGNESLGISFALLEPGIYRACTVISTSSGLDAGEAASPVFQIIETPTNAQTLTLESGAMVQFNLESGAADLDIGSGTTICGVFNWSHKAAGTVVGIRLMYEMSVSGAPDYVVAVLDADANNGQRVMNWQVFKVQ